MLHSSLLQEAFLARHSFIDVASLADFDARCGPFSLNLTHPINLLIGENGTCLALTSYRTVCAVAWCSMQILIRLLSADLADLKTIGCEWPLRKVGG
jgi:hypothetical protein